MLHAAQCWIHRAGLYLQHLSRLGAQGLPDAVAMLGAPLKRLKDEHVQRSLQELDSILIRLTFWDHSVETVNPKAVECLQVYKLFSDDNLKTKTDGSLT